MKSSVAIVVRRLIGMSSFDYGVFTGDDNVFAVSKSMFSEAEADKLFVREQELPLERARKITGWVYF